MLAERCFLDVDIWLGQPFGPIVQVAWIVSHAWWYFISADYSNEMSAQRAAHAPPFLVLNQAAFSESFPTIWAKRGRRAYA